MSLDTEVKNIITQLLSDHLSVDVSLTHGSDDYGNGIEVKVRLEFDDETITESEHLMRCDLHEHDEEDEVNNHFHCTSCRRVIASEDLRDYCEGEDDPKVIPALCGDCASSTLTGEPEACGCESRNKKGA